MADVTTTGSTKIAILSSKIVADLCAGKFFIDLSTSTYISSGKDTVLGANVQITNPYNVIVKPYGSNYEISPIFSGGMDGVISFNIPTQAGNYQYGKYKIDVQLFDGTNSWTVTKYVSICEPDKNNKTKNYGSLSAILKSSCKDGKLYVIVDGVPTYNGAIVESQVNDFTVEYPTSSGLSPLDTTIGNFSVTLFEGVYKVSGTICATYNFGDNVYVKVNYKIKKEKNVRCLIDECCVFTKLSELHLQLKKGCTQAEIENTTNIAIDALRLLKTAQLAADCGEDPSDYIDDLEKLLGCVCTCNCAEGTPIIDNTPAKDFVITGCNVSKETSGLTDTYTIENYEYVVEVTDNGGALTISVPALIDCTKTQTLTFSIDAVYSQIKTLANQNNTEADFWASVINKALRDIVPDCLDVTQNTWNGWTFKQKVSAVISQLCECCGGCDAAVSNGATELIGGDVLLSWTNDASNFYVDIFLDGILKGTVAPGLTRPDIHEFLFEGAADGSEHSWALVPKCSNGSGGTPASGTFGYVGCPEIAPPDVSSNNVNGVECPYDLTSLVSRPPDGITVEWHTANNTKSSSLVPNPSAASSGVYYAFSKNADGCFSIATQVTLICDSGASCTAPQNLQVIQQLNGSIHVVTFQSAAFPPPGNSYTVKRKLYADPDLDGSYTTIGTPTWNAFLSRWAISDPGQLENTFYTYKAISNCADSPATTPSVKYNYANITCHDVSPTPASDHIDYSLSTAGYNEIDKYEVKIYDATGTILLHTDTFTPAFANPITGSFIYLTPSTSYKIVVTAYIGTFSKISCSILNTATTA